MIRRETMTPLSVCVDCMQVHANGETSGEPDRPPLGLIPVESTVALGGEHSCDDPMTVECECEILGFSWQPCDACGSALGGDRFAMTMFSPV